MMTLPQHSIQSLPVTELVLDNQNPRLSEYGIRENASIKENLKKLWDEMGVDEIVYSIVSNGFWDYEPLIALKEDGKYQVLEGNRRLAAVKVILDAPSYGISLPSTITSKITDQLKSQISTLPVLVVQSKEEAWRYIGFKHVNGPAKWGSFAKAKYIAEIHNQFKVSLSEIAFQLGDTHNTVQKLYQGLMVLEQAERARVYNYHEDVFANRIFFSHLYTGLQREGIREFLQVKEAETEDQNPVPEERLSELGELLGWIYGRKKDDSKPLVKSQNPDLKYLDEVLGSKEALSAIRSGEPLEYAHELSRSTAALFEENLLSAKRNLQKARAYLSEGYQGEENLLKISGSIANLADDLYNEMLSKNTDLKAKEKKNRVSE